MKIEHSPLMNEFISFWFETRVDDEVRCETMLDFMRCEWYTTAKFDGDKVVLKGELNSNLSEDDMVEEIKPLVESAIHSGQI